MGFATLCTAALFVAYGARGALAQEITMGSYEVPEIEETSNLFCKEYDMTAASTLDAEEAPTLRSGTSDIHLYNAHTYRQRARAFWDTESYEHYHAETSSSAVQF